MADILVQDHGENKTAAMELQAPDSQAAPLFIATYYTLGFSFWHNENSEDYAILLVNSKSDEGVKLCNKKRASRDRCDGEQRAVLGWV